MFILHKFELLYGKVKFFLGLIKNKVMFALLAQIQLHNAQPARPQAFARFAR